MQVPSDALRRLMHEPAMSQLVLGKMTERLGRTAAITDLPRFAGIDQATAEGSADRAALGCTDLVDG
jgi:hypothetical protein